MNIISISIAVALCISANVVAMEQPKKQEQTSSAEKSVCWMCRQENVDQATTKFSGMQAVLTVAEGSNILILGGKPGPRYSFRGHTACYDPILAYIQDLCITRELQGAQRPADNWQQAREELLFMIYTLAERKNKTVQMYIQENNKSVPKALEAILNTGVFITIIPEQ